MFVSPAVLEDTVELYDNLRDIDRWEIEAWHRPEDILAHFADALDKADAAFTVRRDDDTLLMMHGYIVLDMLPSIAYPWTGFTTEVGDAPVAAYRIRKRENERLVAAYGEIRSYVRADNEPYRRAINLWGASIIDGDFLSTRGVPCFMYRMVGW